MSNEMTSTRPWDRQPDETDKSYSAFQMYLTLPQKGGAGTKRSLATVAKMLNQSANGTCENWSAKYNWISRCAAYDLYMATAMVSIEETTLKSFQQNTILKMGEQLAVLNEIIDVELNKYRETQRRGEDTSLKELKNIVDTLKTKDDLARRMAAMPTQFMAEKPDDKTQGDEDIVYVIGGAT